MALPTENYFSTRYDQIHPSPQHIGKEVLIAGGDELHVGTIETTGVAINGLPNPRAFGIRLGRTYNPDGTILDNGRIFNTYTSYFNVFETSNINSNVEDQGILIDVRQRDLARGGKRKTKQKKTKQKKTKLRRIINRHVFK